MGYQRTQRRRRPPPLSGWFSDVWDANVDFFGGAWNEGKAALNIGPNADDKMFEASVKARVDRMEAEARRQVAAEEAARAQLARAGGAMIPPPLTDAQRDLAVLMKVDKLKTRATANKVIIAGLLGLGGWFAWSKLR